jgi:hypothetical protein
LVAERIDDENESFIDFLRCLLLQIMEFH